MVQTKKFLRFVKNCSLDKLRPSFFNDGLFLTSFIYNCEFESNNVKVDFENDDKVVGFNYKINSIF